MTTKPDEVKRAVPKCPRHEWTDWKDIGRTGDWFHPLIVERTCTKCGATETEDQ